MAVLKYDIKPHQIDKLIAKIGQNGGNTTLTQLKALVIADIEGKLQHKCAECTGIGMVNAQTEDCPTCHGYCRTENQETVTRVITKTSPKPTIEA